jgi:hypothetical protein
VTPAEYVEVVVLPTVRDFMAKPADRRLAYLAAIAAYHIPDYLMRASRPANRDKGDAELKRIRARLRSDLTHWYDVIEGMANGAKHCGRDAKGGAPFKPGDEEYVPPFGFGEGFGGFGQGRWDGPGLRLSVGDERIFVDNALGYFLLGCARLFPDQIPSIQPSDWDSKFKPAS